ncbi:extracellular solute-binding protein [Streptococcus gallolyticus]|nr:extracellular solute-binding protein [Streptococcus gallolyticus]MBY5040893.1 extracellular solute-binding protein [Streptococcus gallolyticus]
MKTSKKILLLAVTGLMGLGALTACSGNTSSSASDTINVVSREEGSGTRSTFIELFGVEEKDANSEKVDNTAATAIVANSTSVMLTTVSEDAAAIGYASLGSLNDSVKVLDIDGNKASVADIKDGSYKISRPFNIITKEDKVSQAAQDFIDFILSTEGQKVVEKAGYIPLDNTTAYTAKVSSGKVVVAGSSSVTPIMEKIKEAYQKVNAKVDVEIQQSDSSTGITSAIDGLADIGIASRELKDEESGKGVASTVIATDGIAVVVNKKNKVNDLTTEQVKEIFTGKTTSWADLSK